MGVLLAIASLHAVLMQLRGLCLCFRADDSRSEQGNIVMYRNERELPDAEGS